jgi:hypothetical protein
MSQQPNTINIIPANAVIGPDNRVLNVYMTEDQYEEMLYCIDQVQRNRQRALNSYYDRKARGIPIKRNYQPHPRKEKPIFPSYQQVPVPDFQEKELLGGGGGRRPLQLVVNKY